MSDYPYTECGLDHVYLRNGYRIEEGPYGQTVSFCALDNLHRMIAILLCFMPNRLQGQHVRFFRSRLNLSQKELADLLGVQRVTVARWEGASTSSIPGAADRALRVLALNEMNPNCAVSNLAALYRDIGEIGAPRIVMQYSAPPQEDDLFTEASDQKATEDWHKAVA